MNRRALTAVLVSLVSLVPATAAAEPVAVKVIDVAGGSVYLTPGRAAGIVPGTPIRLRGAEVVVVEVTEKTAMVRIEGAPVAIGDSGTADVARGAEPAIKRLDKPRPAEAFAGQWSNPVLPATQQVPRSVPLSAARAPGRAHTTVIGHVLATAGRGGTTGDAEARVVAAFDVSTERPLAADLDVAARWFGDGYDRRTHTPLFVRAAQLRYGAAADDPRWTAGRLASAAAWIGMLDGVRASTRLGPLELAAFGGLVPDPLSGKPGTGAARFGGELGYDAPDAAWQPRVSVAVHGSTWNGELDERRLSIAGSAGRGALWLDGWAEAQGFASSNPWGASGIELTGAGATAEWRAHGTHAGVDVTFLRPERSLRLAATLPPEWLCTLAAVPDASDRCAGDDWWGAATVSAGTRTPRWAIDAVASLGDSHRQYRGLDRSGYLRGELRVDTVRLLAGLSGGTASFASWTAAELGLAYVPSHALDLAVTYRPEVLDYAASTELTTVHSATADARLALSTEFDLALSAIGAIGADRDAFSLLATFVWRPLP
jgi:hypothetical protein